MKLFVIVLAFIPMTVNAQNGRYTFTKKTLCMPESECVELTDEGEIIVLKGEPLNEIVIRTDHLTGYGLIIEHESYNEEGEIYQIYTTDQNWKIYIQEMQVSSSKSNYMIAFEKLGARLIVEVDKAYLVND